ncbi:synaptic vesicle glycoprotein 2B-like isoform X2 [Venturia canescens]|uniref:synaptic vesicle glycoprotein 2B-like isoform X2 n=1 Tax=Venturia canescens TaxID=32260 RepID=UPI001C9BD8C5|nr:synaptic vesicle glycoprotein 2B-like isoform X2 [Venturia canescens]
MTPSINYQGDDVEKAEGPADFERAIKLTGYGRFNYLLLLAILPAGCASIYSSTSMSYVLSSAECDLSLTLFDKGLLNSMPFAGMIVTSFFWGFMTDTFGRKKILMYGYLTTSLVSLSSSLSQTSGMLIFFKFLNGVVISGPFSALMSYLAEVHGEQQRSRIYMWLGIFYSIAHITMPCLAWLIIPQTWQWSVAGGTFRVTSWRIFLAVCAIPEVAAFIALSWFPESPRFLLSKGRDQDALEVFRRIYSLNSGKEAHTYPVKSLENEVLVKDKSKSLMESLSGGWQQIKPLFNSHYVFRLILIGAIQFGGTVGSNSLRLWMPQLFTIIETYEANHPIKTSGPFPSICVMIDESRKHEYHLEQTPSSNRTVQFSGVCAPVVLNSTVYINSIVIALTGVIGYTLAGTIINAVGKKKLMVFCFLSAGLCCGVLYWAEDSNGILGISAVFVALSSIGGAAVINFIVDNFPTCLRTMAISITMMSGRFGAVAGNLLFPVLFDAGCLGPFVMIGIACLICSLLVFFIPQKDAPEEIPEQ